MGESIFFRVKTHNLLACMLLVRLGHFIGAKA